MTPKPTPKRMGRPVLHGEPMESLTIRLPSALVRSLRIEARRATRPTDPPVSVSEIIRRRLAR